MQELAFLKSAVARISACKPDILVVERNVAGFAVRALENEGITLVYNVTAENLQKLAINLDTQVIFYSKREGNPNPVCLF